MNCAEEFYYLVPSFYDFSSGNVSNFASWHLHDKRNIITCISYRYFHQFCCTDCHFNLNPIYLIDC